jgi:hypothetical protein
VHPKHGTFGIDGLDATANTLSLRHQLAVAMI